MLISVEEQVKFDLSQEYGILQCCHIVLCQEIRDQKRPVCWSIVTKDKPTVGSPYFGAFPSDRIPKAIKASNEHILFTVTISVNYTSEFRELLKPTACTFIRTFFEHGVVRCWWAMPPDSYWCATPACLLSENTYPGVIKPESIKGQLEVKILVDLWYGIVDVCLVVTIAVVTAFVKETVQEFTADLPQASFSDDVGIFIWSNSMGWWSMSVVSAIWNRRWP